MSVTAALRIVLLVSVMAAPGLAVSGVVPWPTMDFDREALPDVLVFYRFVEVDLGTPFLDRSTFAVLAAPQMLWTFLTRRAENESWTASEIEQEWQPFVSDWETSLNILVYPQATQAVNTRAGKSGRLTRFVLESSTGYRQVIQGDDLAERAPKYNAAQERYENTYRLVFDRPLALARGTEWLRLYVVSGRARMYFEWRFGSGKVTGP